MTPKLRPNKTVRWRVDGFDWGYGNGRRAAERGMT